MTVFGRTEYFSSIFKVGDEESDRYHRTNTVLSLTFQFIRYKGINFKIKFASMDENVASKINFSFNRFYALTK